MSSVLFPEATILRTNLFESIVAPPLWIAWSSKATPFPGSTGKVVKKLENPDSEDSVLFAVSMKLTYFSRSKPKKIAGSAYPSHPQCLALLQQIRLVYDRCPKV